MASGMNQYPHMLYVENFHMCIYNHYELSTIVCKKCSVTSVVSYLYMDIPNLYITCRKIPISWILLAHDPFQYFFSLNYYHHCVDPTGNRT